jgi:uncharacterized protein with PQ loop repeat
LKLPSIFTTAKWVSRYPAFAAILIEFGHMGQVARMWREQTSAGQSLTGWVILAIALCMWLRFYQVITPKEKFAKWATLSSIFMILFVIVTIVWFRYLA